MYIAAETPGSSTGSASGQSPDSIGSIELTYQTGQSQSSLGRLARDDDSPTPPRGHLSQQPGRRIRYVEPGYWAYDPNNVRKTFSRCSNVCVLMRPHQEETIDTLLGDQTRFDIFDPLESLEKEVPATAPGTGTQTSATVSEHGSSLSGISGGNNLGAPRTTTIPYRLTGDLAAPPPAVRQTPLLSSRWLTIDFVFSANKIFDMHSSLSFEQHN